MEVIKNIGWKNYYEVNSIKKQNTRPNIGPEDIFSVSLFALCAIVFILILYYGPPEVFERKLFYLFGFMIPFSLFASSAVKFHSGRHSSSNPRGRYWATFTQVGWIWLSGAWLASVILAWLLGAPQGHLCSQALGFPAPAFGQLADDRCPACSFGCSPTRRSGICR